MSILASYEFLHILCETMYVFCSILNRNYTLHVLVSVKKFIWNANNIYTWSAFRFPFFCSAGITTKDTYEAMRKNDHLGEKFLVIIKDYGHYLKSKDRKIDQKYYQPNYFDQIGYIEKIQLHSRPGSLGQTINTFKVLGQFFLDKSQVLSL